MAEVRPLSKVSDSTGIPGTTAAEGGGIGVGVSPGMEHQGTTPQIIRDQSRCHHIGDGASIRFDHKPAQISPVTLTKGPLVGTGLIRIPVPASFLNQQC